MSSSSTPSASLHPMRLVTQRTGLSPDVLRVWERRYGAVTPARSAGGQRLYSETDVERLALLARAVRGGRAIGQIARSTMDELRRFVDEDASALAPVPAIEGARVGDAPDALQKEALAFVERFDSAGLESALRGASLRLGMDALLDGVIGPLLVTIGNRWHAGLLGPAQEHLATAVIRRTLAWMMESGTPPPAAPTLVVATPAGQAHELGAMLAAAAASSQGWRVVYLGASLPAREIAVAATRTQASAVALSLVHPGGDPAVAGALRELRAELPAETAIVAGGGAVGSYAEALATVGAVRFASIGELRSWLRGWPRRAD